MTVPQTMSYSSGRPKTSRRTPLEKSESWAVSPGVRRRMQLQRTRDTGPEMAVRRIIHAAGFRYRVDACPVPGLRRRADIVFRPARVAVFVDGCFWHGCTEHGRRKYAANTWYWPEKIENNRARDRDTDRILAENGWLVIRVWEHEQAENVADRTMLAVQARRKFSKPNIASGGSRPE